MIEQQKENNYLYETNNYYVELGTMTMLSSEDGSKNNEKIPCYHIKNKRNDMIELETVIEAQAIKHLMDVQVALDAHKDQLSEYVGSKKLKIIKLQ